MKRCFGTGKPLYERYHDEEWGVPVHEDRHLFEMLSLEGAQAGLSWELILNRREGYRRVFHQFEPQAVSEMSDAELEAACNNPAIIRNRRKIFSVRVNAEVFLKIQKEFGTFDHYVWGYVNHTPTLSHFEKLEDVPCFSKVSDALAKDLKMRGMSFVGTKIIYSFMQAVGMVNDHLVSCSKRL